MGKQIRTITYCTWSSIGSILQSYGLYKTLETNQCMNAIWVEERSRNFNKTKIHSLRSLMKALFEVLFYRKRKDAYQKRMNFITQNMNVEYFSTYNEFKEKAEKDSADIFLAGSDQIWHPNHCNPIFFLDFVKDKKRVSYAASMGKTEISSDKMELFGKLIRNFDSISVREQECASVISNLTNNHVSVHIDPTFLISSDDWRKLEVEYKIRGPYILLYMLYYDKSCKEKIRKLKRQTGLPVYAISNSLSKVCADKVLYDVGVEEFLWLIDHAQYVVTSSFHGVALSIIFNKKFAPVINPVTPSRISHLLRILSVPTVDIEELASTPSFDYQTVNELIAKEKEKSLQYIRKVID